MKFYLKQLPNGRVYLSQIEPKKEEGVIKVIDADEWIKAREIVHKKESELGIVPNPGYGYVR
jgi:hypothetical protein